MPILKNKNQIVNIAASMVFCIALGFIFYVYDISWAFLAVVSVLAIYIKFYRRKQEITYLNLIFIVALTFSSLVLTRNMGGGVYTVPVIALVILITVLFEDIEFSFVYCLFASLLVCSLYKTGVNVFLSIFISSMSGAFFSTKVRKRTKIIRAGIIAGAVEFFVVYLLSKNLGYNDLWELFKVNMSNGFISSVIVIGILPLFEMIFGVITNISLLELSDFNHPLLRKMILEAPGTYQHSLVVANLAETAAEEIGANSLLARVGSYYHDIGKISKAEYFSENQMLASQRDKHKKLNPSMSRLIIMNHVKEGIDSAKKNRLNKKLIDFIAQHHGTTLVYYFYKMAQTQSQDNKNAEETFRYPGPKPQSKEVAIVHLADTIEARSRALDEPSPSRIKEMVRDSINKKFLDGQLDDSDLTLKDLESIAKVFIRILNAMFHTRIDYPKEEDDNNKANHKPPKDIETQD